MNDTVAKNEYQQLLSGSVMVLEQCCFFLGFVTFRLVFDWGIGKNWNSYGFNESTYQLLNSLLQKTFLFQILFDYDT